MLHLLAESGFLFHSSQNLRAIQCIPIGSNDRGIGILLTQHGHAFRQFCLAHTGGMAEDNGTRVLHLIVEKLTEVLHIHLALLGIHHGSEAVQFNLVRVNILHRTDHVAQLAHAGGLDQDALGGVVVDHLLERAAEIAHQAAADTTGVHLRDLHAGLGEERGVHADLAEFVLDQHQFFRAVRLGDQLLYESGFAGSEKAGENIYFSHNVSPSEIVKSFLISIAPFGILCKHFPKKEEAAPKGTASNISLCVFLRAHLNEDEHGKHNRHRDGEHDKPVLDQTGQQKADKGNGGYRYGVRNLSGNVV